MKLKNFHIFIVTIIASVVFFLITEPPEKGKPLIGFNILLYKSNDMCYHIHHWMYMIILVLLISIIVIVSNGVFNKKILMIIGFLIGGILGDLKYKDFEVVLQKCEI